MGAPRRPSDRRQALGDDWLAPTAIWMAWRMAGSEQGSGALRERNSATVIRPGGFSAELMEERSLMWARGQIKFAKRLHPKSRSARPLLCSGIIMVTQRLSHQSDRAGHGGGSQDQ